jgi:hypothetical protein
MSVCVDEPGTGENGSEIPEVKTSASPYQGTCGCGLTSNSWSLLAWRMSDLADTAGHNIVVAATVSYFASLSEQSIIGLLRASTVFPFHDIGYCCFCKRW